MDWQTAPVICLAHISYVCECLAISISSIPFPRPSVWRRPIAEIRNETQEARPRPCRAGNKTGMRDSLLLRTFRDCEWELLRFLGKRLGSTALASDIAQDLYIKLLRSTDHPPVRDGRAYLFTMAANLATDHLPVERRRSEILSEADDLVWRRIDEIDPERRALARDELAFLETAIADLPDRCRRVFYMNRYEGRSQAEIAEQLGIGLTTVYKDLKLALKTMTDARRRYRRLAAGSDAHDAERRREKT